MSFESLKGICDHYAFVFARALMQFPNESRDLFIFAPSISLIPLLFVLEALSEPARSMSESFPTLTSALMPQSLSLYSIDT